MKNFIIGMFVGIAVSAGAAFANHSITKMQEVPRLNMQNGESYVGLYRATEGPTNVFTVEVASHVYINKTADGLYIGSASINVTKAD